MSLQNIVDNATSISFNRGKLAAQTISRSGRVLTSEVVSSQPFQFDITMSPGLKFSTNRALIEEIDRLDIVETGTIDFGGTNTALSYLTAYQGGVVNTGLITINGYAGANLYINAASLTGSGYLFKAGDVIQPGAGYKYPYTVTADVVFSTDANVTIPVHRPIIAQTGYTMAGSALTVGPACTYQVKMMSKPSYTVVPNDRLVFNSAFKLIEVIEG